ncbi:MAG: hypothetical protein KAS16_08975 [Thermoplasmata archaeon]|nr:hypothetical protein [Thermoplasmata archaeon]
MSQITSSQPRTLGKALQKIFQQEGLLKKIEAQESDQSILMNTTRRSLFFMILERPCSHLRGLAKAMGSTPTSLGWHMKKLAENGYVLSQDYRNKKVYWINGMLLLEDVPLFALLNDDLNLSIMKKLIEKPGMRERELVEALGSKQQILFKRMSDLQNAGLVVADKAGHGKRYRISDMAALRSQSYLDDLRKYQATAMALLVGDGLRPRLTRRYGTRLHVELNLPGMKEKMKIECEPWSAVLGKFDTS